MKKITYNTVLIALVIFINACAGYKPIYSSSNLHFEIADHAISGDKKLGNELFSKLYYLSDSKKENPETKSIYVSIEIIKEKNSTVKNSAGKILEYKIILDSKILLTDYLSGQKILDYKSSSFSSYRVQEQYSETLRLENTAAENILEKIYQDLLIKLSEKMLTE